VDGRSAQLTTTPPGWEHVTFRDEEIDRPMVARLTALAATRWPDRPMAGR
jgi:hypothetical protein